MPTGALRWSSGGPAWSPSIEDWSARPPSPGDPSPGDPSPGDPETRARRRSSRGPSPGPGPSPEQARRQEQEQAATWRRGPGPAPEQAREQAEQAPEQARHEDALERLTRPPPARKREGGGAVPRGRASPSWSPYRHLLRVWNWSSYGDIRRCVDLQVLEVV